MNKINNLSSPLLSLCIVWTLCCLLQVVRPQCISDNDRLSGPVDTNLAHIQDFNVELFKEVFPRDPTKNFVFSPYSVWNSLVLAYFGSRGETQKQFEQVLRVADKVSTLQKWRQLEFSYLSRQETSTNNNTFVLSNRIYFDKTVRIRYCMENILHNEISQLDFLNDARRSADSINKFVSETTRGHIEELVSPTDVMFAHMVLVNAAYFQGTWATQFDPKDTRQLAFTTFNSESINVPMMTRDGTFNYGYFDEHKYETLELPYVGDTFSFYIFLPYKTDRASFDNMINSFTSENISKTIEGMWETKTQVFVPSFSLNTLIEDDLLKAIFKMGLQDAFIRNKANFSDFGFDKNMKLDRGIHKAFITVNEEGTEAGAATAFIANKIGGNSMFVCNRPFVFLIRDKKTKNILFIGAYKQPDKKKASHQENPSSRADVSLADALGIRKK